MYCVHCGKEISDGSAYCVHCGKPQGTGGRQPARPAEKPLPAQAAGAVKSPYDHPAQMPEKKKGRLPVVLGASAGGAVLLAVLIFVFVQFILPAVSGENEPQTGGRTESSLSVPEVPAPAESGSESAQPEPDGGQPDAPEQDAQADASEAGPEPLAAMEPVVLQEGETAECDLDGDGRSERIALTSKETEDGYYRSFELYLNEMPVPLENSNGYAAELWIVDIGVTDGQKEFCFSTSGDSECLGAYSIVTWRNGAPLVLADLKTLPIMMGRGSVYRKITQIFPGDGTFTVLADTPVYNASFGCMYVHVPYIYDGEKIKAKDVQVFEVGYPDLMKPEYVAYTPFKAYLAPGSDAEAFTAAVGAVYAPDQLALIGGTLYLHVSSEDGAENGWILEKGEMDAYYETPPAWG